MGNDWVVIIILALIKRGALGKRDGCWVWRCFEEREGDGFEEGKSVESIPG